MALEDKQNTKESLKTTRKTNCEAAGELGNQAIKSVRYW